MFLLLIFAILSLLLPIKVDSASVSAFPLSGEDFNVYDPRFVSFSLPTFFPSLLQTFLIKKKGIDEFEISPMKKNYRQGCSVTTMFVPVLGKIHRNQLKFVSECLLQVFLNWYVTATLILP